MAAKKYSDLIPDVTELVKKSLRQTAVEIMNGLSESGPAYSGKFSSAWYAVPLGKSPGGHRSTDKIYRYDLRNVPKAKFKKLRPGAYYEIVNGMSYAPEALDLKPGEWRQPEEEPIKEPVNRGTRTGPMRFEVTGQEKKGSISTAPKDWYNTYIRGGGMVRDLGQGVKLGFRDGPLGTKKGFG